MTNTLTVIIPVFRLTRSRERNFWYVLKQLKHAGVPVCVVEQLTPDVPRVLEKKILQMYDPLITHTSIVIDDTVIHKSRLINHAIHTVSTTHAWVNDADCLMDFTSVVKQLDLQHDFIRPYAKSFDLTQSETHHVIETDRLVLGSSVNRRVITTYGALSFVFRITAFKQLGMMDEQFIGWGLEDVELDNRLKQQALAPHVTSNVAYHMWHTPSARNSNNWHVESAQQIESVQQQVSMRSKIVHVINYRRTSQIPCEDQATRVSLAAQSIEQARTSRVMLIACGDPPTAPCWYHHQLTRWFDDDRPLPYIRDLLLAALSHARENDRVLITNSDCVVSENIYQQIGSCDASVVELHRRDVNPGVTLDEIVSQTGVIEPTGIDGFVIRGDVLRAIIHNIPDLVLGAPCWDLVLSSILKTYTPVKNYNGLYHVKHTPGWSFERPDQATHHNIKLSRDHLDPRYFTVYDNRLTYTNELCVMVLCCAKEVLSGQLETMMYRFFGYECSIDKRFDVFICVDTIDKSTNDLLHKQTQTIMDRCDNINNMIIHDVDIPPDENMFMYSVDEWYTRRAKDPTCLQLGTTSGVNIQFFESVKHVFQTKQQYNNLLLLETDCEPISTRWYDRVVDHCSREDFVVMGSKYRGVDNSHRYRWYRDHLNGVAVYRNTPDLFRLLDHASQVIKNHVNDPNTIERWLNFDVAMWQAAFELNMTDKLVDADIISNYSDPASGHLDIENVLSRDINTIILHKKQHETI